MKNSVSKLALDECYSEKTQKEFANYRILSNKPAAGLIFQSRNYGRVYWKGGFIREAGLLFQYGQRGGAIIFSIFIS